VELAIVALAAHLALDKRILDAGRRDLRLRDRECARVIVELACALECTLTWLVGLTDTPGRWQPDGKHWPRHTQPTTREVAATVPPLPSERVTLNGTPPILGPVEF